MKRILGLDLGINSNNNTSEQTLLSDLQQLIENSRQFVAVQVNSVLTMLFWNVGKRNNDDILQNRRADYGKKIVSLLATIHRASKCATKMKISG
ncbi:MAG: DUF1016 N-terminal domain-containing protein [Dysgonamonadaceae bacterium]|jgi:hypothetical protein|nr:DUF1016 N-terminal domain-containing protein [Dysgonamonadaceae bacterium]